jgi:hypothetical protein
VVGHFARKPTRRRQGIIESHHRAPATLRRARRVLVDPLSGRYGVMAGRCRDDEARGHAGEATQVAGGVVHGPLHLCQPLETGRSPTVRSTMPPPSRGQWPAVHLRRGCPAQGHREGYPVRLLPSRPFGQRGPEAGVRSRRWSEAPAVGRASSAPRRQLGRPPVDRRRLAALCPPPRRAGLNEFLLRHLGGPSMSRRRKRPLLSCGNSARWADPTTARSTLNGPGNGSLRRARPGRRPVGSDVEEPNDHIVCGQPELSFHVRVVRRLAGPPHRPVAVADRRKQEVLGGCRG